MKRHLNNNDNNNDNKNNKNNNKSPKRHRNATAKKKNWFVVFSGFIYPCQDSPNQDQMHNVYLSGKTNYGQNSEWLSNSVEAYGLLVGLRLRIGCQT